MTPNRVIAGRSSQALQASGHHARRVGRAGPADRVGKGPEDRRHVIGHRPTICDSWSHVNRTGHACPWTVGLYLGPVTWRPMALDLETERLTLRQKNERDAAWYRELLVERGEDLPTIDEATRRRSSITSSFRATTDRDGAPIPAPIVRKVPGIARGRVVASSIVGRSSPRSTSSSRYHAASRSSRSRRVSRSVSRSSAIGRQVTGPRYRPTVHGHAVPLRLTCDQ